MNIIEAAKAAGWTQTAIDMASKQEIERLERFAQVIRNQALEDAAKVCEEQIGGLSMFATSRECIANNGVARYCASAIRAMKKDQQ